MMTFTHAPQTVEGMISNILNSGLSLRLIEGSFLIYNYHVIKATSVIHSETIQEAYTKAVSRGWLNYPEVE